MLNPLKFFATPEYFFNPRQAVRRVRRIWQQPQAVERLRLPWGAIVQAHTGENIGRMLYYYGVFDKVVPEAIFRLLDPGETAVEIGANIGQNCSCMARRVGPAGVVFAFEPHPEILAELRSNVALWPNDSFARTRIEPVALSSESGEAYLDNGAEFETNRGSATVRSNPQGRSFKIKLARLDDYLREIPEIAMCKIDVEGHELDVLRGAAGLLKRQAIRNIIFEDFHSQPSPVAHLLKEHGFELFKLGQKWSRPTLLPLETTFDEGAQDTHNFLATLEPDRARARYRALGWRCLMAF